MEKRLIGFSGKMTSGKTTMAEKLVDQYGFKRMAIGNEIKRISNMIIEDESALEEFLNGKPNKEVLYKEYLDLVREVKDMEFVKEEGVYKKNKAYRYLTQKTGDILRNELGSDIWVRIFLEEVKKEIDKGNKVVCDDIRMMSEYELLSEFGFDIIRLEVKEDVQKGRIINLYETFTPEALTHKTETELDNVEFEKTINTTFDTVEKTYEKLLSII